MLGSSARGPCLHRIWGDEPPPPTTTGPGRRQLTVQSRGFFTSRHGKGAQLQSLGHERVATLALTLKVHPVTGGTDFRALLFHLKPGELARSSHRSRPGDRPVVGRAAACTESRRDQQ